MTFTVLFSKAGTYFVSKVNGGGGIKQWKWNDDAETQLLYSWGVVPVFTDDHYVDIPELSSTKLIIIEYKQTYILQPVSTSKSVMKNSLKNSSNRQMKSGFFNK